MNSAVFDTVVVGGGMVGTNIAHALAKRGLRVAVIEKSNTGSGTSANSFAWINATAKVSDRTYFDFNASGCESYRVLAREWGDARIGLHRSGMIESVSSEDGSLRQALSARAGRLEAFGYPVRRVTASELRVLEPQIDFKDTTEGLFAFGDAWLDIPTFLGFLNERIRALGGEVREHCEAQTLMFDDVGEVAGVQTSDGEIRCRDVVVATGPDTAKVLTGLTGYEAFETRFPVQRVPGLLVTTPPATPARGVNRILYAAHAAEVHMRPTRDGALLLGSEATDGMIGEDSTPEEIRTAASRLLALARGVLPDVTGEVGACCFGIGVRAVPADGQSIVGPLPGSNSLTVVVTHSGVTLGLVVAEQVADWIVTKTMPTVLKPFGLERFQGFA